MIKKLTLYFHTVRYLKPIQIIYQLYYIFIRRINKKVLNLSKKTNQKFTHLIYTFSLDNKSYVNNTFRFLNISHHFEKEINWELMDYGKLWQYNLSYFDFLNDSTLSKEEGIYLIKHFISCQNYLKSSNEPYPISLRVINWIRFVNCHKINDVQIIDAIYLQAKHLTYRLEYHLLGNHLLENGFSLLHAAKFFSNKRFYKIAKRILDQQLKEQILSDGGHFELSPMYHQIVFYRTLESIDILKNNHKDTDKELLALLFEKSTIMLNWLNNMTFTNGDIPLLNDSANGIAPSTFQLQIFAKKIGIHPSNNPLTVSGYRKFIKQRYEAFIDVGPIGPKYQPGHAHADMLNLIIYKDSNPFLIEVGTSTYQINPRRHLERSTESHNTVVVNNENQSQVWSGFRVAKRANMFLLKDDSDIILARHDGYKNILHQRQANFLEKQIIITDTIFGEAKMATAHWHFHSNIVIKLEENKIKFDGGEIIFENFDNVLIEEYYFAPKFNELILSKKIKVNFQKELITKFFFNNP
jgi:hypothetical protein